MKEKLIKKLICAACFILLFVGVSSSIYGSMHHLSTANDHMDCLFNAFRMARRQVLVTTNGVTRETIFDSGLSELIAAATRRGVKVYIYNDDTKNKVDKSIVDWFKKVGVNFQTTITHAKILTCDSEFVAVGSCNWLCIKSRYPDSRYSSTLISQESFTRKLINNLWQQLRNYQSVYHGKSKFDRPIFECSAPSYKIDNNSTLTCISTLNDHEKIIDTVMLKARERLIICSTFPSVDKVKARFPEEKLEELLKKGVKITFVYGAKVSPEKIRKVESYFSYLICKYPGFYFLGVSGVHVLSVIVDDDIYIDSSFNWLSAASSMNNPYHSHEVSMMVDGSAGRYFVDEFLSSSIGREIISKTPIFAEMRPSKGAAIRPGHARYYQRSF